MRQKWQKSPNPHCQENAGRWNPHHRQLVTGVYIGDETIRSLIKASSVEGDRIQISFDGGGDLDRDKQG